MNKNIHPLQSHLWGEFRKKTGVKIVEKDNLLISIHPIPYSNYTIGYLPKGPDIDNRLLKTLETIGKEFKCIFIQIEPNIEKNKKNYFDKIFQKWEVFSF